MAKLPQGWVECQLKDIATVKGGKRLPAGAKYSESITNYPYIRVTNFENMTVNTNDLKYLTPEIQNKIKNYTISKEDIYISIAGSIGKVGIIPDKLDGANLTENAAKIIHCINKKFLTYILNSIEIQNQISTYTKSTTQPKLALYRIEELKILLPPLKEQKRIVEKIESEFAKIDEGLEHLEQAKEKIKQYRQSVLKSAFSINNKNEKCLDEITNKINDGTHKTPTYIEKGIPFISVKDIRNKQIFFDNCKFISEDEHQILFKRCNPEYGDVLITKSGTIGRTAIVNTNKIFDLFVSVALLKPKKDLITSEFLMYALDNYIASIDVKQEVKGGVIKNLHIEDLKKITICLPPLGEQKKIVEEIEKRFSVADEVEKVVDDNIEKAKQLKQSILKKAFEGRLVPQDLTDEPASILLEKIKKEKHNDRK